VATGGCWRGNTSIGVSATVEDGATVGNPRQPIEAPGDSYTLNPTGQPHSAMITSENIALVIYSGESDDVKSVEIVDIEPGLGQEAQLTTRR
jgi:hypothetical protein